MTTVTDLFSSDSPAARVAAEVRGHAAKRGLRQEDLARVLGVSQAQVSARLRGRVPFTVQDLYALAGAFKIQPGELLPECAVRDSNPEPAESVPDSTLATVFTLAPDRLGRLRERRKPKRGMPVHPLRQTRPMIVVAQ